MPPTSWSGWWFKEHGFYEFPSIGNFIIPTDFHSIIFQRGRVGQPPTRNVWYHHSIPFSFHLWWYAPSNQSFFMVWNFLVIIFSKWTEGSPMLAGELNPPGRIPRTFGSAKIQVSLLSHRGAPGRCYAPWSGLPRGAKRWSILSLPAGYD